MPVKGTLSLKGLEKYIEDLSMAGKDVDASADRALTAGADVALEGMLKRVPVASGYLKDHIKKEPITIDGNLHVIKIGLDLKRDRKAIYGVYQEFGTANTAAQPFIRPTFDEDRSRITAAMRKSLIADGKL